MILKFKLLSDGAFVAADLISGYTAYAYPTSIFAETAKYRPEQVAGEMMRLEMRVAAPEAIRKGYDALNWAKLS